jgi:nicotinate-nucleotide adenylyltransferase
MRQGPRAARGLKVGLLGGSFDPAHEGHAHVAETALRRLGLHAVWWLVTPQNPLKPRSSPLEARMASARKAARGPHMIVTDIETRLGTSYTFDTLAALHHRYPGVQFVWLMGADNLDGFARWRNWQDIVRMAPVCVVSRPGAGPKARLGAFARVFWNHRLRLEDASALPGRRAPAWLYIPARWNPLSSTALRAQAARAAAAPVRT